MRDTIYICRECGWVGSLDEADYTMTSPRYDRGGNDWEEEEGEYFCPDCGDEIEEAFRCEECGNHFVSEMIVDHACTGCTAYRLFDDGKTYGEAMGIVTEKFSKLETVGVHMRVIQEWVAYQDENEVEE